MAQPTTTTSRSRKDLIRESLFALLGLWFTTLTFHAIFLSPYYTNSPPSSTNPPTKISIVCPNKTSIPKPDAQPCTLEYAAVVDDPWDIYDALGTLGFCTAVGWIASLVLTFCIFDYLQDEADRFKTAFAAIGIGVLGLVWAMFEPFGFEERKVKGYIEWAILPVGLVVSLAVGKEVLRIYRAVPQADAEGEGKESSESTEMMEMATTQQKRRYGDLEAGRA